MSTDDERSFQVVPPAERPRKVRSTVRVVLVSPDAEILLLEDSDPGLPDHRWWVVPGGGMDPGETPGQTAVREIAEETGLALTEDQLVGPVASRQVVHGYTDQVIEQDEAFYVAHVPRFEVDTAGHTEEELVTLHQHRWWPLSELATTSAQVWPAELLDLVDLADQPRRWPVDLGHREESTVPDGA